MLADILHQPVRPARAVSAAAQGAALGAHALLGAAPPRHDGAGTDAGAVHPGAASAAYQDLYAEYRLTVA